MGAADQRDPTPEPHDQPGGTVQRAGAGGLESGGGWRGGEEGKWGEYIFMSSK